MATVTDIERGQLILVASIGLAVTFVALALILNSVIYTGNLASRNADSGASDAIAARQAAVGGLGGVMDGVNDPSTATDYPALESNYQDGLTEWTRDASRYGVLRGRSVRVATATTGAGTSIINRGVRIVDTNRTSTLTPRGDTPVDWTVAPSVRARHMQFVVTDALATPSDSDVETELSSGTWTEGTFFYVDIDDGEWRMAVYGDGSGNVKVAVYDNATSAFTVCPSTPAAPPVRIDVGEGTVNGVHCEALSTIAGQSGPYDIHFANSDQAAGEYELTVDRVIDGPTAEAGPFTDVVDRRNHGTHCAGPTYYAADSGNSPHVAPALYSSEVDVHSRSQSVEYHTTARVAAAELSTGASSPQIASLSVDDQSSTSLLTKFVVTADVVDPDGDLNEVVFEIDHISGSYSDSATKPISGWEDTASATFNSSVTLDADFNITVTARDGASPVNERSVAQRHTSDGDGTGDGSCPE